MVGTKAYRLIFGALGGAALVGATAGPAAARAQVDPPGNNGTVKIDGVVFDDHPDNEPHVGCTFQVDFYGFDEGDLTATVLFEAIPPTTDAVPAGQGQELLSDEVPIGEDAAGGGTDLDASRTYDLTDALAAIQPHPQQGWHVQLTVHAEGSQGADTKHKVFWVSGCETAPTTSSTSTSTPGSSSTSSSTSSSSTSTSEPGHGSTTSSTPGGSNPSTSAPSGGVSPTVSTTPTGGDVEGALPTTGSNVVPLVLSALVLMGVGAGLVVARRLRLGRAG